MGFLANLALPALLCGAISGAVVVPAAAQPVIGPFADEDAYLAARSQASVYLPNEDVPGLIRGVELFISDQVEGRCWTNSDGVEARLRVELERSGVAVYHEPIAFNTEFDPIISITVLGYRLSNNGPCAGTAEFRVSLFGSNELGAIGTTGNIYNVSEEFVIWEESSLFTSGTNLDNQLLEWVQTNVDKLIADILRARRSPKVEALRSAWPKDPPMTKAAFDAILKGLAN